MEEAREGRVQAGWREGRGGRWTVAAAGRLLGCTHLADAVNATMSRGDRGSRLARLLRPLEAEARPWRRR